MIQGAVNARREAIVLLRLRGPNGVELDTESIVDTGFTAALTLPATTIAALALVQQSAGGAVLADGSISQFAIYIAEVLWDGTWRPVLVSSLGAEVLLGMQLLERHELRIAVVPSGTVDITPMP